MVVYTVPKVIGRARLKKGEKIITKFSCHWQENRKSPNLSPTN
jgi:hypothetical protein